MNSVGYAASLLVLLTFCMKQVIPLRVVALFGNVTLLPYARGMRLMPIILLHSALTPHQHLQTGLGHPGAAPFTRRKSCLVPFRPSE